MKKRPKPALLSTLFGAALYSSTVFSDELAMQCMHNVPAYARPLTQGDPAQLPVTIKAGKVDANSSRLIVFTGDADVQQGNRRLRSDELQLHESLKAGQSTPVRTVDALGNVHYDDDKIILEGLKAWSNLDTKDTTFWQGQYWMVGRQGRGSAETVKRYDNDRYTVLKEGTFTSCLPGDNSWILGGSEITLDQKEEVASIWNAYLKIGPVPVFYTPYLQLPIGDRRRSGLLLPRTKYSDRSGLDFVLPYYWNISPQLDATITPHYISHRGLQWQNEFRYLHQLGAGILELDYLPSDRAYRDTLAKRGEMSDDERWLFYWKHDGVFQQHWRVNADFTRVSDYRYFSDLESPYFSSTDGYATQKFSLGYADKDWTLDLSSKSFQLFDATYNSVYLAQPELEFNYYLRDFGPFEGHFYAQGAKFLNVNNEMPNATRFHFEPTITFPFSNRWSNLSAEATLLATYYQQNNLDYYNNVIDKNKINQLESSVSRVMPQVRIDSTVVLERKTMLVKNYTQTLAPRVQYLYVPYRDQRNIQVYDSSRLQPGYISLFRQRSYSGLDRIASANQLVAGVTTHIYDADAVERFNASVGQIYVFTPSKTGIEFLDKDSRSGSLIWAGDSSWRLSEQWGMLGGLQYNMRLEDIDQGDFALEYRRDSDHIVQLNYRYNSSEYAAKALENTAAVTAPTLPFYVDGISQVGTLATWPLGPSWKAVAAYYYNLRRNQPAEQLVGFQYSSCCYAIQVGYKREIKGWQGNASKYDNQVLFNIEFRGLNANYGSGDTQMLRQGILPYQSIL